MEKKPANVLAVWSINLALASVATCCVSAVPALFLSVTALVQCIERPGHYRNPGTAWAGLALSSVALFSLVALHFG